MPAAASIFFGGRASGRRRRKGAATAACVIKGRAAEAAKASRQRNAVSAAGGSKGGNTVASAPHGTPPRRRRGRGRRKDSTLSLSTLSAAAAAASAGALLLILLLAPAPPAAAGRGNAGFADRSGRAGSEGQARLARAEGASEFEYFYLPYSEWPSCFPEHCEAGVLAYDFPEAGPVCFCDKLCFVFSDCCPESCNVCGAGCEDIMVGTPDDGASPGPIPAVPAASALQMMGDGEYDYIAALKEEEGEGDELDATAGKCSPATCGKGVKVKLPSDEEDTCFCDVNCVKNGDCCSNFEGSVCNPNSPQFKKAGG